MKITFPDSSVKEYHSGIKPVEIAREISKGLAERVVVAEVNGIKWEVNRPITVDASLQLITYEEPDGMAVYWHSTAHVMAHAVKMLYPEAKFGVGPSIENGFYYDMDVGVTLTPDDFPRIEEKMHEIIKADRPFERTVLERQEVKQIFIEKGDEYKLELIDAISDEEQMTTYTEGDFVDLCRGPHLPSTGKIKHFKLLEVAGAYWRGDERNKMLTRIYGISYPKKKLLEERLIWLEEVKKRNHKKLGKELDLFSFQEEAPGAPFWHPNGLIIYNEIIKYWKEIHLKAGYMEVKTPIVLNEKLWHQSGHWDNYKDNMYFTQVEDSSFALKPMNCPGHCLIYRDNLHSYRELPLKLAELGLVHRYEKSGVLNGLFRVRAFTQDDAHVYCMRDQIEDEIIKIIKLTEEIYHKFGFNEFRIELSTRPDEKYIGEVSVWEHAENALKTALENSNTEYELNPGEGAFYGPKIDYHLKDSLGRFWQCATIQLDFQMPERFGLEYIGADSGRHRPVMIHRAILGSIERFIAILIEHHAGSFPFWLAPVQVKTIPIAERHHEYASSISKALKNICYRVESDLRNEKMGYKIREAEIHKIPYMLIVGDNEMKAEKVAVRRHHDGDIGEMTIEEFIHKTREEI